MRTIIVVLISVMMFWMIGCSSSEDIAKDNLNQIMRSGSKPVRSEVRSDTYVIRQGDSIQVSVWGYQEFSTSAVVKGNGTLSVPLIGEIITAGLTKEQFVEQLRQKLSEYIQGEVKLTVTITSTILQRVSVLGSVTKQDNYPITTDVSLLEILTTAGGTTTDSDLRHIKILRGGMNLQPVDVDLTLFIEKGNVESIPLVHPGDIVYVPKKANVISELSEFLRDAIFIFGFFKVFD